MIIARKSYFGVSYLREFEKIVVHDIASCNLVQLSLRAVGQTREMKQVRTNKRKKYGGVLKLPLSYFRVFVYSTSAQLCF